MTEAGEGEGGFWDGGGKRVVEVASAMECMAIMEILQDNKRKLPGGVCQGDSLQVIVVSVKNVSII